MTYEELVKKVKEDINQDAALEKAFETIEF